MHLTFLELINIVRTFDVTVIHLGCFLWLLIRNCPRFWGVNGSTFLKLFQIFCPVQNLEYAFKYKVVSITSCKRKVNFEHKESRRNIDVYLANTLIASFPAKAAWWSTCNVHCIEEVYTSQIWRLESGRRITLLYVIIIIFLVRTLLLLLKVLLKYYC